MLRNRKEFKLPEIEEEVLAFWKTNAIFEKSLKQREGAKRFKFFEGPPTANGRPGIHHVLGRAFKDVIPRYKTMRGFFVRRQAGWDTHGLPVEIEVEKSLGLKNKQEIEKFGIAEFNEKAKASVWKYQDEWEKLTDRVGYWLSMKDAYITYKPAYVETLWWVFRQIADKGLLTQSFKITPYCPRCQTPLSSHEMGQPGVYKKVKDPSVFVKFKIKGAKGKKKATEYLLVWTTTPWTLPSNVAIAVNPELSYTKYKIGKDFIWSYNPPPMPDTPAGTPPVDIEVIEKISGQKMIGWEYEPLFKVAGPWLKNKKFFRVYGAEFVSTEDGTGLVHIAPAFGEDDMQLIKKHQKDLVGQIPITIDGRGIVQKGLPGAGRFAKQADKDIIAELTKRGVMLKSGEIEHDYPFCWRCGTPILYFSRFSWFIEMSALRDELLRNNERINWVPEHIKEGRFGEWLREIKDWAVSRDRYWGTPLPIWKCEECEATRVVGSLEDLDAHAFATNNFYLLRHGEAEHNVKDIVASGPEKGAHISKLTKKGIEEATHAGENMRKILKGKKLDLIVTSPYHRTKQTARIVAKATKAKVIVDKRLRELDTGIFNWRPVQDHKDFFASPLEEFTKTPPGGENLNDVKRRMFEVVRDLNAKYANKNILIVSHGDPLWVLEGMMRGLSNEEMLKMDYINTDGSVRTAPLHNWPYNLDGELDIHRPYVDELALACSKCKSLPASRQGKMLRVKEVADVWFDSGAMPFAQVHYPFAFPEAETGTLSEKSLEKVIDFPADYISEGIDQTRGWFYTLLAVSTALGLESPYKNVITLGLVLDKNGQKMSKSKGNTVSPWDMMQKYGADIVRWYFYTVNPPSEPKRFDELDLGKMLRKYIMILYNSFVFLDTYGEKMTAAKPATASKNILDQWIMARLNQTMQAVTEGLETYDVGGAGKALESFTDDLSRWYIRRSRARLQRPADGADYAHASATLWHALHTVSLLTAPFTPFFADALYLSLTGKAQKESVHLEDWPEADKKAIDYALLEKMEEVRRISSAALAVRAEKGVKVRQPLQTLEIKSNKLDVRDTALLDILKDEVNVKEVRWNFDMADELLFDLTITPELKAEGTLREVARMVQGLRHDANYIPTDAITLMIEGPAEVVHALTDHLERLKKDVGAKEVQFQRGTFDAELSSKIDGQPVWVGVKKV
ncbi:class I tRNA ligase family protein [Patescibacteria group bacterium]|nr:class I tRNA ligase family protein [Patescibacteria group bacterium]